MRGSGVVLASYGRGVLIEPDQTQVPPQVPDDAPAPGVGAPAPMRCSLTGRKQRIVCGDRIRWTSRPADDGASVETVEPRRNLLERIDLQGRAEPVAANIDRVAIVVAPEPVPDWFLVDRYWAGAQLKDIPALLVANKLDRGLEAIRESLDSYRQLGMPCLEVTAVDAGGMPELRAALAAGVTLLVGQSGVGKSSLVNALVPEAAAQTAALTRDAEGRHTTTTARRYRLPGGAAIVDAPGVRDFAPPAHLVRAAQRGFVEIHAHSSGCRFNDCRHMEEPGCAVRAAVEKGAIGARRYESYRRLCRLYERLAS